MNRKNPSYQFKRTWAWPCPVENFIREKIRGSSLHVCCGESEIGDIRVDLYEKADIKGDMFHLPIKRQSFDTVICDPPWELPYHKRHKLLYELRDCLKVGGILIFNAFWFPKIKSLKVIEWWVGIPNSTWRNVSLLIVAQKVQAQLEEYSPLLGEASSGEKDSR
jgi:ubiquinone/menaquinone biosynthesis C-methylase UbiE